MGERIRVLRLIEYTYDSLETMEKDMARWTISHGTLGKSYMTMRSAAMPPIPELDVRVGPDISEVITHAQA